jgi:SOS-response transcriptional repressor LexA
MRPHRRELIQRFVRSIAPDVMVSFSSAEIRRKKYYKRSKQIELHPANKSMKPIIIKDKECEIRGLMVGLIRTY